MHRAQHNSIPFENFDVALGKAISLSPEALFSKLVINSRGGYCFEVNGLLLMALTHFGFDARPLLGRVHMTGEASGRGHQLLLVTIHDEQWIVDAGFGAQTPGVPIPLVLDQEVSGERYTFRLTKDPLYGTMLQIQNQEEGQYQEQNHTQWANLYSFDLNHVCDGDISFGNHYSATHQESIFVTTCVAALPIDGGVATLHNRTLKKVVNGTETIIELDEGASYLTALREQFGISFKEPYIRLKPLNGLGNMRISPSA
ncbi:MAG: arylamine N-acetyltransferase [Motiliproteus sp.]|nr:arylamine N-acetyltransferase [Motiliproteus sp.]